MFADADLAAVADLMSGSRAGLLLALSGGDALPAGELARRSGLSPSLASSHLSKLLDGGLVAVTQKGRERRYSLAGPQVAQVLEAMMALAPERQATGLREANRGQAIRRARTCYDHLAGELGVAVTDSLARQGVIELGDGAVRLTEDGRRRLEQLGVDVAGARERRRAFARTCIDWTERRPHLAGALGAALARRMLDAGWVARLPGSRAVRVTDVGARALRAEFGLRV